MRKIIQIAAAQSESSSEDFASIDWTIVALCDDGSLWWHPIVDGTWNRVDPIPQDEVMP